MSSPTLRPPAARIRYLDWARAVYGRVRYDLGSSNAPSPGWADLGLDPATLTLQSDHREGPPSLLEALSDVYGVATDRIFCGPGAAGVAGYVFRALLRPGERVLCETPSYEPLWRVPEGLGNAVDRFDRPVTAGARIDLDQLRDRLRPTTRLVVVTDLHNPSGRTVSDATMQAIGDVAAEVGAVVVVDEVYREFLGADAAPAATRLDGPFLSLNSLTKVIGLGMVRVGWAIGAPEIIAQLRALLAHGSVNLAWPAVQVGIAALSRRDALVERSRERLPARVEQVARWAAGRTDVAWHAPDAGQVGWLELTDPATAQARQIAEHLLDEHATVLPPGDFFDTPRGFRLGLGANGADLAEGLARLGRTLDVMRA